MSDSKTMTLREMAEELISMLGKDIDEDVAETLRSLHARGPIRMISAAIAYMAVGQALLKSTKLSLGAEMTIQAAAFIEAKKVKVMPAAQAALELTDEERAAARRLGAKFPKVGKA